MSNTEQFMNYDDAYHQGKRDALKSDIGLPEDMSKDDAYVQGMADTEERLLNSQLKDTDLPDFVNATVVPLSVYTNDDLVVHGRLILEQMKEARFIIRRLDEN